MLTTGASYQGHAQNYKGALVMRRKLVIYLMELLYWQMQKLKSFNSADADLSTELLKWHKVITGEY
jgi:hypothetical protein